MTKERERLYQHGIVRGNHKFFRSGSNGRMLDWGIEGLLIPASLLAESLCMPTHIFD